MSEIRKNIEQILKLGFNELLRSQGFKKSGRKWSKKVVDDWLLVSVQASSVNRGKSGKFAVNLGIYNTAVEQLADRFFYRDGQIPNATGATLETRLNELAYDRYHWWEVTGDTDLQNISNDVVEKMDNAGFPWLFESNDYQTILSFWNQYPSVVTFSTVLLHSGEQEAIRCVKQAIEAKPKATDHYLKWAKKVGLKID